MSGAHAQHRTPNRPVFHDIEIDNPEFEEGGDQPEKIKLQLPTPHPTKMQLVPIPCSWDQDTGLPEKWKSVEVPAQLHVLDHRLNAEAPSKHAKGRAKQTNRERRVGSRDGLRAAQSRMTAAEDAKRLAGD